MSQNGSVRSPGGSRLPGWWPIREEPPKQSHFSPIVIVLIATNVVSASFAIQGYATKESVIKKKEAAERLATMADAYLHPENGHVDRELAGKYVEMALEKDQECGHAWFTKGEICKSLGETDKARVCFKNAHGFSSSKVERHIADAALVELNTGNEVEE